MSDHRDTLVLFVSQFPDYESEIRELYQESTNFLEICKDFAICLESIYRLEYLKGSGFEKDRALQEALSDLKEELMFMI